MKKFLLNILKFIIILLSLFFVMIIGIILFHTSNEIRLGEFSHNCLMQTFVMSLFTSSFIAVVIFNGFCISDVTIYRLMTSLIPVVITTVFVSISLIFIKKEPISNELILSADARIYFTPNSFNNYLHIIDKEFASDDFEENILSKIDDDKTRDYFKSKFTTTKNGYILKPRTLDFDYNKLRQILYSIGYFQDTKYYFSGISKNAVESAIIVIDGEATFYHNLLVTFSDKYIYIMTDDNDLSLTFARNKQINSNFYHSYLTDTILNAIESFPFYFIAKKSVVICILIWLSFSMLLVAIFSIVWFKGFKFISLIIQTVLVFLIYVLMPQIMGFSNILAQLPAHNEIFQSLLFAGVLIFISTLLILLNIFVIKSGVWEQD